jgi:hypothetical protein
MFSTVARWLSFSLISATSAFAYPIAIASTPVQGQISQIMYGPSGTPTGLVLADHTLLEFPPESLIDSNTLRTGDTVSASGVEVLSAPNRVFDRVALRKGDVTLFDNSRVTAVSESSVLPAGFVGSFKEMAASAPLVAVSSTPDGLVDALLLQDGSTVQIPSGAYVNPSSLHLGQIISASGAGEKFSQPAAFLHAQSIQTVGGQGLIQARGYDGEKWTLKQGAIQQAMVTPRGEVDGFFLADKSAIRFSPVLSDLVAKLTPGTKIRVAGPGARNQIGVDSLIVLTGNTEPETFVSLAPARIPYGTVEGESLSGQLAGQVPQIEMIPMQDHGKILAVFTNSREQIDTVMLDDGTRVWIPPRLRLALKGLKPGQEVTVTGLGGTYVLGSSIAANTVKNAA